MHALFTPNDTSYNLQWHYYEATGGLNAPPAWDKSTGTGIVAAVIDTGYRPHADLAANILQGYDFIGDTFVANDGNGRDTSALDPGDWVTANQCGYTHPAQNSSWHGTHVAGTIAAVTNNALGVAGVAFGAKIVPARVSRQVRGYTSDIADAIVWSSGGAVSGRADQCQPGASDQHVARRQRRLRLDDAKRDQRCALAAAPPWSWQPATPMPTPPASRRPTAPAWSPSRRWGAPARRPTTRTTARSWTWPRPVAT
jgi:hypothetical protein